MLSILPQAYPYGKDYKKPFITDKDIMVGGNLEFTMRAAPNKDFGKDPKDRSID